jgi:ribosomal protein L32
MTLTNAQKQKNYRIRLALGTVTKRPTRPLTQPTVTSPVLVDPRPPVGHSGRGLLADKCPSCERYNAAGGYCPDCGTTIANPSCTCSYHRKGTK